MVEFSTGTLRALGSVGEELDCWGEAGLVADFWWRDDDAGAPRPELKRLLELARDLPVPLHLSVIPSEATVDLLATASELGPIRVLQHGWSHTNHEPGGTSLSEFGKTRPGATALGEVARGRSRLIELFGQERVLPVLVPPWNTISLGLIEDLPSAEIHGLSTRGARRSRLIAPGVVQINTHVDITDWRRRPCFLGVNRVVPQLLAHLQARRLGRADAAEPTGLLTHHWANDSASWEFLESLGRIVLEHPAAKWVMPDWR